MATNKNIIMKQFNGTDYDTLYPKTVAAQIDDVYSKDETYPKSQLYTQSQIYTKEQMLTNATKTLYSLGADAVPDNAFQQIKTLIDNVQSSANSKARIQTGSYVGTGTYGPDNPCSLTFDFIPSFLFIQYSKNYCLPEEDGRQTSDGLLYGILLTKDITSYHYWVYQGGSSYSSEIGLITWGTTISWYIKVPDTGNISPIDQFNGTNGNYSYVAIG